MSAMKPDAWMTPGGDVSRSLEWCKERCWPLPNGEQPTPLYTLATVRKWLEPLLEDCKSAIEGGIETVGDHEPEWSKQDRILVAMIAAKLREIENDT